MNFKKIEHENGSYLDGTSLVGVLTSEKDAL